MPGGNGHAGSDLRIDSRGDGDETVHLVLVQGDERPLEDEDRGEPTAVPTEAETPMPTETPVSTPTPGVFPMVTPSLGDLKRAPTPIAGPLPPPNGVSDYGGNQ